MKFDSILKWRFVKKLGSNKLVKRAYIYLLIVPLLAKVLSKVNTSLNFVIFGENIQIIFELPFNLKVFYLAALCFTIGYILFSIFAPDIIKENDSLSDFFGEKKGARHLYNYSVKVKNRSNKEVEKSFFDYIMSRYLRPEEFKSNLDIINSNKENKSLEIFKKIHNRLKNENSEIFWFLYNRENNSYKAKIKLVLFFYLVGFCCISLVFIESVITVFKFL